MYLSCRRERFTRTLARIDISHKGGLMFRSVILGIAAVLLLGSILGAQTQAPKTHRLEATPSTVAYGYYWAEAKPALRIASGDIIDVDTLLTNNPTGLQRAGVPAEKVQDSLRAIVEQVTG